MQGHTRITTSYRFALSACVIALLFSGSAAAVPSAAPGAPAVIGAGWKSEARIKAEKLRDLREAKEQGEAGALARETMVHVAEELVRSPDLPKALPRASSQVMSTAVAGAAVTLDSFSVSAANAGANLLQQHLPNGRLLPVSTQSTVLFALGAAAMAGAFVLSTRRKRHARKRDGGANLSSNSDNPIQNPMFGFLRRKSAKKEVSTQVVQAVVIPMDMAVLRDYAYNLLFARGRHDLTGVTDMVTPSFLTCLTSHFQRLEAKGHWNKVERVSNVECVEKESWHEGETSYAKLLVSWKALDYVVNFNRRQGEQGYLVEGDSKTVEQFEEEWVVKRKAGGTWLVDAMYPAPKANPLVK